MNSSANLLRKRKSKNNDDADQDDLNEPELSREEFETKAIMQALEFERSLQELRRNRNHSVKFSWIRSNGYGRFLTSHYNPGSAYISFLNNLSQKLNTKSEKKRIEKEMRKREEDKIDGQKNDDAEANVQAKKPELDEIKLDQAMNDTKEFIDSLEPINEEKDKQKDVEMKDDSKPQIKADNQAPPESAKPAENSNTEEVKTKPAPKGEKSKATSGKSRGSVKPSKVENTPKAGKL